MISYWGVDHGETVSKQDQTDVKDDVRRVSPARFKRTGAIVGSKDGERILAERSGRGRRRHNWRPDEDK